MVYLYKSISTTERTSCFDASNTVREIFESIDITDNMSFIPAKEILFTLFGDNFILGNFHAVVPIYEKLITIISTPSNPMITSEYHSKHTCQKCNDCYISRKLIVPLWFLENPTTTKHRICQCGGEKAQVSHMLKHDKQLIFTVVLASDISTINHTLQLNEQIYTVFGVCYGSDDHFIVRLSFEGIAYTYDGVPGGGVFCPLDQRQETFPMSFCVKKAKEKYSAQLIWYKKSTD